jgi:hypothetical protein
MSNAGEPQRVLRFTLPIGIVASVTSLVSACAVDACDTGIFPSIIVEVRDSVTGAAAAAGAEGRAIDGSFVVALGAYDVDPEGAPLSLATPGERAGTYTVQVTKPGYSLWERTIVQVDDFGCHTDHVQLSA